MRTQRVFILSSHALLARAVGKLLQGRRGLRVVGTETDLRQGIERIHSLHPDVVILGSDLGGPPSLSTLSSVFEASPGTVVVGLSTADNLLHVYQDNRIQVAKLEDLIQALRRAKAIGARKEAG